jgi:diguanylate cyclase (GGDEF)-like protein
MHKLTPALSPSEPDPYLLKKLVWVNRVLLSAVALISVAILTMWLIPALGRILPGGWQLMKGNTALAALLSAISLEFSEPWHSKRIRRFSLLFAGLVTLLAALTLIEYWFHISLGIDSLLPFDRGSALLLPGRMAPQTASGLALVGISTLLIGARNRFAVRLADLLVFCLGLLVLILFSGHLFGALRMFGLSDSILISPQTLLCFLLLTLVVLHRRAENGVFSIFLGRGIGSRIARILTPIFLLVPFLRETVRAHILSASRMPAHYAAAMLASLAAMLSFLLLLFLAWRINNMEIKIHDLSLRDELTGLYNLRGFHLLAEQSLRLAYRNQLPFSVLFIDLDNLKQINDSLGHGTGSAFLAETGDILRGAFRETDVLGRIGGDEFAVAGQFGQMAISLAAQRLRKTTAQRNAESDLEFPLSFSLGHVTSEDGQGEPLDELLAKADQAMYQEKRQKKATLPNDL